MLLSPANAYRNKIVTADELVMRLQNRLRSCRVVLCNGVFDLVHPGHIRHLLYAREKADFLVVSVTADIHIAKGKYRPFVPEEMRALNLAALECVDYVVIDRNPTPVETILRLKPAYFAKGFEYSNVGEKTKAEIEAVQSYGGEILFTPGGVVFSSSHIIETSPPNLSLEKLLTLMSAEGISFNILHALLAGFDNLHVHVVGDTIVDSLTYTTMLSSSGKTPTPSVLLDRCVDFVGGAAIVAKHLRAAGANVTFSTVLGDDKLGEFVLNNLDEDGIECHPIIDRTRPTTHKNAFVCGDYRMLKVDTVDNRPINAGHLGMLVEEIHGTEANAIVMADFRHGIFNRNTIPVLCSAVRDGVFRVADSQVASRWGNILEFGRFDLITPNEKEARFALADQDAGVRTLAARLREKAEAKTVMLKLGERGLLCCRGDEHDDPRTYFAVDSFANRCVDAVGAGDALLSYATLSLLVDRSEVAAAVIGSFAAAIACENEGNIPVDRAAVCTRIDLVEELCAR